MLKVWEDFQSNITKEVVKHLTELNHGKRESFVLRFFCTVGLSYKLSIRFQQPVTLCQEKEQKDATLLSSF